VVSLHGATSNHLLNRRRVFGLGNRPGESDYEAIRNEDIVFPEVGFLVLAPYGRGEVAGYNGLAERDVLRALADVKRAYNVDEDRVYCLASAGQLNCLSLDGKAKWKKNYTKDFGGVNGGERAWAYSESVLIDGDVLICTPGGKEAAVLALNKITGETVWKCELPTSDGAEYSSIVPVTVAGDKQYVTFLRKGLVGVDAKTGKFLWQYAKVNAAAANIMTPVVYKDQVFAATSTAGALLELKSSGDPKEVYFSKTMGASIGSAVLIDGHLYGSTGQGLFCAEFATGKEKWVEKSIGNASICFADGRLYVRSHSSGDVVLVEANPKEYVEKGRVKQPERTKTIAWPHPIVANGGLYVRDMDVLVCWEVKK
jgi:outer membrane protein assembly factor BamB